MSNHVLIYETPAMKIGKHTWKLRVCQDDNGVISPSVSGLDYFSFGPERRTHYFFNAGRGWWPAEDWPTYDSNHGYMGLPRSLAKLFYKYETHIRQALIVPADGSHTIQADPQAAQLEIFSTLTPPPVWCKIIKSDVIK